MLCDAPDEGKFGAIAERLLNNGWPTIPCRGKTDPCVPWKEYQRRPPRTVEVRGWAREFPSADTAVVTGPVAGIIGLDFDCDDGAEALRIYDIADEIFGPSPVVRVGRYPRTLRLYRGERLGQQTPIGPVEVLNRGHLAIVFGTHPITKEAYRHVGESSPLDLRPKDLPVIKRKQIEEFRREVERKDLVGVRPMASKPTPSWPGAIGFAEALKGVPEGRRHAAMLYIASACRGVGDSVEEAKAKVLEAAARCRPPYSPAEATAVVQWCFAHFPAGRSQRHISDPPGILSVAYQHAVRNSLTRHPTRYDLFLGMARDLQQLLSGKPIALPQRRLGELLKCTQRHVSSLIAKAMEDGNLIIADSNYRLNVKSKMYWYVEQKVFQSA